MERIPLHLLSSLRTHWDGRSIPAEDSPAKGTFEEVSQLLCEQGDRCWPIEPSADFTQHQYQCCALLYIVSAVVWNGMAIGVLVNQPGVLRPAIDAARELQLPTTLAALQQLDAAFPQELRGGEDSDARLKWLEAPENSDLAERIDAIGSQFDGGPASNEIFLACVRMAVDYPQEFFEAEPA